MQCSPMVHEPGSIVRYRLPNRTPGQAQSLNLSTLDLVGFCLKGQRETAYLIDAQAVQGLMQQVLSWRQAFQETSRPEACSNSRASEMAVAARG